MTSGPSKGAMTSFDLATIKVKGPIAKGPEKKYTTEEIKDKLKGYVLVPREDFEQIPSGSHVRYIRSDGVFRAGGFVTCNPGISGDGRLYIVLRNDIRSKASNLVTWTVFYDDLSEIYIKNAYGGQGNPQADAKIMVLSSSLERAEKRIEEVIAATNRNISKLNDKIKKLERMVVSDEQSVYSGATSIHPIDNYLAGRSGKY